MALDEAISIQVRKGSSSPTLRLYGWDIPSLSLGHFQKLSDINIAYCKSNGIPIVRRPTGGRAILHDKELTYSFSVRTDNKFFSKGLFDSYKKISEAFILAFKKTGIQAKPQEKREKGRVLAKSPICFKTSSFGEITIQNKKIVGSAQKRWIDGLLQQGCIPFLYNEDLLLSIFGQERTSPIKNCMTGLKKLLPDINEDDFKKNISESFEETFGVSFVLSHPSQEELLLAGELEFRKYPPIAYCHQQGVRALHQEAGDPERGLPAF
jgi:lipoyl(octanoyl) transferase